MIPTIKEKEYIIKSVKRFWFGYKVCEGCDILLTEDMSVCPVCKSYRFDDTKERVVQAAEELLNNKITE